MVSRISGFLRSIELMQRREERSFLVDKGNRIGFFTINQRLSMIYFRSLWYYLEIAAVFEGILVDTYLKLFLDYIVSHCLEGKVDQMGFFNGEVDLREEREELSFGHHSAGQGDFQTLGSLTFR